MQSLPQYTGWVRIYRGRARCIPCRRFHFTMQYIITSEPRIGVALADEFNSNPRGRRAFIKESHDIVPHELVEWIKTMLQHEESHTRSHCSETEQGISENPEVVLQVDAATGLASQQNDTRAAMHTKLGFTQERFHCHIARYYPPKPHYDSARYRTSSHVARARSNPLRFVRSAR